MFKKSYSIPYDDNLKMPSVNAAKNAVAIFCGKNGFVYEFKGITEEGNTIVEIDHKDHVILRGFGLGEGGRGGYGISCKEL